MTAPADNCGNCLTPENSVTVAPYFTSWTGDQVRAWYRCPGCGHEWPTSWDAGALGAQVRDGAA